VITFVGLISTGLSERTVRSVMFRKISLAVRTLLGRRVPKRDVGGANVAHDAVSLSNHSR
jgi:hypothetical protein